MAKKKNASAVPEPKEEKAKYIADRDKRMLAQLEHVNKTMGKAAVRAITEAYTPTPCHGTGISKLDKALNGGVPKGRITEMFGNEGGGKTTLSINIAKQAQQAGGIVHFIDAEHKFDESILDVIGIDRAAFQMAVPDTSEKVWNGLSLWLDRAGPEDLAIVDSLAMMRPQQEINKGMAQLEGYGGDRAKINAMGINQIKGKVHGSGGTVLIINQIRHKMGISYGNPETTPGGDELKFGAALRLRITSGGGIKEGDDRLGHICNIRATKCNHARPYQDVHIPLIYGVGFQEDEALELFEKALEMRIIWRETEKSTKYMYGDNFVIKGRKNFLAELRTNIELKKWFENAITQVSSAN